MSPLGALTLLTLCLVIQSCVIIEDGQTKSVREEVQVLQVHMQVLPLHTLNTHRHRYTDSQGDHVPILTVLSEVHSTLGLSSTKAAHTTNIQHTNTPHPHSTSPHPTPVMPPQHPLTHLPILVNRVKEVGTSPLEEQNEVPETTQRQ